MIDLSRLSSAPLLVALLALLLFLPAARTHATEGRALWIWNGNSLFDADELERFIAFAKAPHGNPAHRIDLVFFSLRGGFGRAVWPDLARFTERLAAEGIAVHALAGDPSWALNHTAPLTYLAQVLEYNAQAEPRQKILGFQFDIEPYLVRELWNTPQGFAQLKAGFLDLLKKLRAARDEADPGFEIGVAIPRWYDQEQYEFLNRDIQAATDYVAVMNYWNEAQRLIRDGTGELEAGDQLGKKVYIGVEVQQIDPPTITFYGFTVEQMEAVLTQVHTEFAKHPSYAGLVIHHYAAYIDMPAEQ